MQKKRGGRGPGKGKLIKTNGNTERERERETDRQADNHSCPGNTSISVTFGHFEEGIKK